MYAYIQLYMYMYICIHTPTPTPKPTPDEELETVGFEKTMSHVLPECHTYPPVTQSISQLYDMPQLCANQTPTLAMSHVLTEWHSYTYMRHERPSATITTIPHSSLHPTTGATRRY